MPKNALTGLDHRKTAQRTDTAAIKRPDFHFWSCRLDHSSFFSYSLVQHPLENLLLACGADLEVDFKYLERIRHLDAHTVHMALHTHRAVDYQSSGGKLNLGLSSQRP